MSDFQIIQGQDISKDYHRRGKPIQALKKVNVSVTEGDFFIIIGKSGSGKTTLLNVLSGLDKPSEGRVLLDGEDTGRISERDFPALRLKKVGFIFQDFNLIRHLTAGENIEAPLWVTGLKRLEIQNRAIQVLKNVDLLERKDHKPDQLSGGEQQRVAIARALINNPKILFADEPTGNLDTSTSDAIMSLLRELNSKRGTTIVMVTHDEGLKKYADTVVRMDSGKIDQVLQRK